MIGNPASLGAEKRRDPLGIIVTLTTKDRLITARSPRARHHCSAIRYRTGIVRHAYRIIPADGGSEIESEDKSIAPRSPRRRPRPTDRHSPAPFSSRSSNWMSVGRHHCSRRAPTRLAGATGHRHEGITRLLFPHLNAQTVESGVHDLRANEPLKQFASEIPCSDNEMRPCPSACAPCAPVSMIRRVSSLSAAMHLQ
jgi:hypothetical protein